jgi:predicted RNase H-like HicB family nuclease
MASYRAQKNRIELNLSIYTYKKGKQWAVHCPSLDIIDHGDTENEALVAFKISFDIYIEDALKNQTLENNLLEHGWTLTRKPTKKYIPPTYTETELDDLIAVPNYSLTNESMLIPA